jgi:hypothetical protein
MINFLTKNKILLLSLFLTTVFYILNENIPYKLLCAGDRTVFYCGRFFKFFRILLMIAPVTLLFSLFALGLSNEAFARWRKFLIWYLVLFTVMISFAPWYVGDEFLNIQKAHFAFAGISIFTILSIIYLIRLTIRRKATK